MTRPVEESLDVIAHSYQHISNGGIVFELVKFSTKDAERVYKSTHLRIGLTNFGIEAEFSIPVFKSTAAVLRALASALDAQDDTDTDPRYLRRIDADVVTHEGLEYKQRGPSDRDGDSQGVSDSGVEDSDSSSSTCTADDTQHLLQSSANAERLRESVDEFKNKF